MKLFLIGLGLHLLVLACNAKQNGKDEKELVMLEVEKQDDRLKRASTQSEVLRQPAELSPEYLSFLQQLSASQRDQSAAAQQPQYIQQLVLSKDRSQPAPTRYVLSQDGRLLEESVASYLSQAQQQYSQAPAQFAPTPTQYTFQQQPQAQAQPQTQPPPPARPTVSPELAEFSRQQQRLQQEYADAPLRAQITGSAVRARQRQGQPAPPAGPNSQAPQVFLQPQQQRTDPRLRAQVPTEAPNFVYAPVSSDAQALLQQQLAQLSLAGVSDARQFYAQPSRQLQYQPQQFIYQQPSQQDFSQERVIYQPQQQQISSRRPVPTTPQPQTQQISQSIPQGLPQQYLIETTRQQAQQAQFLPQELAQQVQYVQPSQLISQQSAAAQPKQQQFSSTLLQPVAGRGLYEPKPSRSSIFVTRTSSSTPRPAETESQKIPVVRLPSPTDQRPLTRQELEALVNAGYAISPVPVPVPVQEGIPSNYLKAKRQQPIVVEDSKNHVVYENHQDGVQYQYSPGSSVKVKKSVPANADGVKGTQKAVNGDSSVLTTYVLSLGNESS